MQTLTASEAKSCFYRLIDETANYHQPIFITGKRHNAVLVSAEDWAAIQETLFLLSVPQLRESVHKGLQTPTNECLQELDW